MATISKFYLLPIVQILRNYGISRVAFNCTEPGISISALNPDRTVLVRINLLGSPVCGGSTTSYAVVDVNEIYYYIMSEKKDVYHLVARGSKVYLDDKEVGDVYGKTKYEELKGRELEIPEIEERVPQIEETAKIHISGSRYLRNMLSVVKEYSKQTFIGAKKGATAIIGFYTDEGFVSFDMSDIGGYVEEMKSESATATSTEYLLSAFPSTWFSSKDSPSVNIYLHGFDSPISISYTIGEALVEIWIAPEPYGKETLESELDSSPNWDSKQGDYKAYLSIDILPLISKLEEFYIHVNGLDMELYYLSSFRDVFVKLDLDKFMKVVYGSSEGWFYVYYSKILNILKYIGFKIPVVVSGDKMYFWIFEISKSESDLDKMYREFESLNWTMCETTKSDFKKLISKAKEYIAFDWRGNAYSITSDCNISDIGYTCLTATDTVYTIVETKKLKDILSLKEPSREVTIGVIDTVGISPFSLSYDDLYSVIAPNIMCEDEFKETLGITEETEKKEKVEREATKETEEIKREEAEAREVTERIEEKPRTDEESLKRAIEDVIRSWIKVYRIDWSGMYARISTHRRYVEELEDIVRELGGRVVNRRFSGNLAIVTADFSKATVPREMRITKEQALSYFINKVINLARERNVSIDIGEVYSMFEDEWPAMEGLSDEEKIRMLDLMAEDYVRTKSEEERMPPPPPAAPVAGGRGVAMAPSYERPPTPPQAYRAFSPRNLTPEDWYVILNEGLVEWFKRYGTRYGITEFELPTIAKEIVEYLKALGEDLMKSTNIIEQQAGYILYNYSARALSQYYGEPLTKLIWRSDVYDELRIQLKYWYDDYGKKILKYSPLDVTFIIKQGERTLRRAGFTVYLDNVMYIIYQRLGIKPTETMEKEWVCNFEWAREGGTKRVFYC